MNNSDQYKLDKELFIAARDGNIINLKKAILANANLDRTFDDESTRTALITASFNNHISIVKILLKAGANPNIRTYYGNSALMIASKFNYTSIIYELILGNADVNMTNYEGHTALYHAVYHGNLSVMLNLLVAGSRIEFNMILTHAKENKIFYNDTVTTCNNKCIIILNILEKVISSSSDEIISLIDSGIKPFIPVCSNIWVPRLLPNTHDLFSEWVTACHTDALACFLTFYAGSGYNNSRLVKPRYLTNAHGLRPIRTRIVSYLVHKRIVRKILFNIRISLNIPVIPNCLDNIDSDSDFDSELYSEYSDFSDYSDTSDSDI